VVEVADFSGVEWVAIENRDYSRIGNELTRGYPWQAPNRLMGWPWNRALGIWGPKVRLTYSHGYDEVPDDIVDVVLDLATMNLVQPGELAAGRHRRLPADVRVGDDRQRQADAAAQGRSAPLPACSVLGGAVVSALEAALAAGRREHEAIMLDTVRIWHPGSPVFDRNSGTSTPGTPVELYVGKARVKPFGRSASTGVEAGERESCCASTWCRCPSRRCFPAGAMMLAGDQIQVTSSADPRMTGLHVVGDGASQLNAQATAWRINDGGPIVNGA
jgi:hypothetical protein